MTTDQVEVGLLYPASGPLAAPLNAARSGIDARLGVANAAGGVNGRTIVYKWRDDQGDKLTNGTVTRELVEQENVFAVLETTTATSGGAAYLAEQRIPVVGLAIEDIWARYRNMFAFAYPFAGGGGAVDTFGKFVRTQGGTRALVVSNVLEGKASKDTADQIVRSLRAAGVKISGDEVVTYTPGPANAQQLAERMVTDHVDALVTMMSPEALAQIVAAARQASVPLKVTLTGQEVSADLLSEYGPALAGVTSYAVYLPFQIETPALDAYRGAIAKYAPELADPNQAVALTGYVIGDMLVRGLEAAGKCPTRQSFIDGLRAVHHYDADGLITTTDLDADFGLLSTCYAFVRVNGAGTGLEVVNPNYCGSRLQN